MKKHDLTLELSLLRPCPADSRSSGTGIPTRNASAHPVLHVPAPNVKCKGFDKVIRKPLAPKFLSTHRAAWIPPFEDVDSQRRLAFQHASL